MYSTKNLGVKINAQSNRKNIEYMCIKLSKCIGILVKTRKVLYKSYYTIAHSRIYLTYLIYCKQVRVNAYQTNLEKMLLVRKY